MRSSAHPVAPGARPRRVRAGGRSRRPTRTLRAPLAVTAALLLLLGACTPDDASDAVADTLDRVTPSPPETPEPPDPLRLVAIGDSIGVGTGATTSYVDEYASWLEQELDVTVSVTNTAVNGWTTTDVVRALQDDRQLRAAVADAHVVTVNAGGNDLLQALPAVLAGRCGGDDGQACLRDAVDGFEAAWSELLAEVVEVTDGELEGVRTMDLYRPGLLARFGADAPVLQAWLDEANTRLVAGAEAAGIPVAAVSSAFHGPDGAEDAVVAGLISGDQLHPSDLGHAVIADELAALGTDHRTQADDTAEGVAGPPRR